MAVPLEISPFHPACTSNGVQAFVQWEQHQFYALNILCQSTGLCQVWINHNQFCSFCPKRAVQSSTDIIFVGVTHTYWDLNSMGRLFFTEVLLASTY